MRFRAPFPMPAKATNGSSDSRAPPAKRVRCSRIEVAINSQPRRYVPGSGPKTQPISLLPASDSSAYIVGKITLPLAVQVDKKCQRRQYYIVGWPDLPAAKVTVPCTKIFDYVSPYAVEEWEYKNMLEREEEEKRQAAELAAVGPLTAKKMRSRPPRAVLMDAPPPAFELGKEDEELLARKKASGPSLSTPQKQQMQKLFSEYEVEESAYDDTQAAIDEHLQRDTMELDDSAENLAAAGSYASDMDVDGTLRGANALPHARTGTSDTSSSHRETSAMEALTIASSDIKPNTDSSPTRPSKPDRHNFLPPMAGSSTTGSTPSASRSAQQSLLKTPSLPPLRPIDISSHKSRTGTPAAFQQPVPGQGKGVQAAPPQPLNQFTPAGPSKRSNSPPKTPVGNSATPHFSSVIPETPPSRIQTPQSKKGRKKKEAAEESRAGPPDGVWEVKRLEDMKEIEGVRYFKVRWEGDWPPDENPTWEPEENISRGLIKKFLKKHEAKQGRGTSGISGSASAPKGSQQALHSFLAKKYASVQEAFEAGLEDPLTAAPPDGAEQSGVTGDELRVAEEMRLMRTPPCPPGSSGTNHDRASVDLSLAQQISHFGKWHP